MPVFYYFHKTFKNKLKITYFGILTDTSDYIASFL